MSEAEDEFVGMYEVLEAIEAVIRASDPAKRKVLAKVIDAYHDCCPDEFHWATGAQSPALLHNLIIAIDSSCRPEAQTKSRPAIKLVDRKPIGNA